MEQVGFVKKIKDNGLMELEVKRISACGGGCSTCSAHCDVPGHIVELPNKIDAKVGDIVEIQGNSKNILKYAAVVYLIPLTFLIIGSLIGSLVFKTSEIKTLLCGVLFMAASIFLVRNFDKKVEKRGNEALTATRIL